MTFQKLGASKAPYIPGVKASVRGSQQLTSTGVPALDALLGGGFPLGNLLLIEEDAFSIYAPYLHKYFLAEGVVNKHEAFVAGAEESFPQLPGLLDDTRQTPAAEGNEAMSIAWRYEALEKIKSGIDEVSGLGSGAHMFDLGTSMSSEQMETIEKEVFSVGDGRSYSELLGKLRASLTRLRHSMQDQGVPRNLLRVSLQGLGSPLWGTDGLVEFLSNLRCLCRTRLCVCLVSVCSHFLESVTLGRIRRLCDAGFALESFSGSDREANPLFSDYHGLIHIRQLPRINSLTAFIPDCFDLAFKLLRKRFAIEKLHLPPDITDPDASQITCSGAIKPKLDF